METLDLDKEIARRNKLFKGKTKAQQRVLVCKDIIKQIELNIITPIREIYLQSTRNDGNIQEEILKKTVSCRACAVGSLFLGVTLFKNQYTFDNSYNIPLSEAYRKEIKFKNQFNEIFPGQMLHKIEHVFERWERNTEKNFGKVFVSKLRKFCDRYPNSTDRMIAICNNIIKNKGQFKL